MFGGTERTRTVIVFVDSEVHTPFCHGPGAQCAVGTKLITEIVELSTFLEGNESAKQRTETDSIVNTRGDCVGPGGDAREIPVYDVSFLCDSSAGNPEVVRQQVVSNVTRNRNYVDRPSTHVDRRMGCLRTGYTRFIQHEVSKSGDPMLPFDGSLDEN